MQPVQSIVVSHPIHHPFALAIRSLSTSTPAFSQGTWNFLRNSCDGGRITLSRLLKHGVALCDFVHQGFPRAGEVTLIEAVPYLQRPARRWLGAA